MIYMLDTDTVIYWLKGDRNVENKVLNKGMDNIVTSIITISELYYGAYKSKKREANLSAVEVVESKLKVISYEGNASRIFGQVKAEQEGKGVRLDDADLLIAATAMQHDMILVTNNIGHFQRISNLQVEKWT